MWGKEHIWSTGDAEFHQCWTTLVDFDQLVQIVFVFDPTDGTETGKVISVDLTSCTALLTSAAPTRCNMFLYRLY